MAGKVNRVQYGLELYRARLAPIVVLSIGRFDVSKLFRICPDDFRDLIGLRDRTPPDQRHFFWQMGTSGTFVELAALPSWNTYGEAVGLQQYLAQHQILADRILVISTYVHLRRVAGTFRKVFNNFTGFTFCAVPPGLSTLKPSSWWVDAENRRFILKESFKLIGYRLVLLLPIAAVHFCMRLSDAVVCALAKHKR